MHRASHQDAAEFFNEFVEAFKTFDGQVVAERYFIPFTAFHADESYQCMLKASEVAEYFQNYLDSYYSDGCRSCGYKHLEAILIGSSCMLATVTWELYDVNGATITSWRESYNIAPINTRLMVVSSIDHAT